ncbi:MAG: sulfatase [Proteobacteria bacterium]|nr:sulfatase [Pseudomonadota bacterium]
MLIVSDDLGLQTGCYGDSIATTPNLDKLAEEGVCFQNAFVTHSSCSPSRSSILTGLYPHQNGQIGLAHLGYAMHSSFPTMPAILKKAGYTTGIIGKLHVIAPKDIFKFDWGAVSDYSAPNQIITPDTGDMKDTRDVTKVAELAGSFFRKSRSSRLPFFLMVNYIDPHLPFIDQEGGIPPDVLSSQDVEALPFQPPGPQPDLQNVASYYNCVNRIDTGIGLLLEELEKSGLFETTAIIFISDNGPPFPRAKATCLEAGVQIPFIIKWPGCTSSGMASDDFVSTIDLLPTVISGTNINYKLDTPGRSLIEILQGKKPVWRETICTEFTAHAPQEFSPKRAIRNERYKLIHNLLPELENGVAMELYDLEDDPYEFDNLIDQPEYASIQSQLTEQLLQWRIDTDDPLLDEAQLMQLWETHKAMIQ